MSKPTVESGGRAGPGPFVRGLTVGVLVGAAIAGSRLWRRLRRRLAAS